MKINRRVFAALVKQTAGAKEARQPLRYVAAYGPDLLAGTDGRRLALVHPNTWSYSQVIKQMVETPATILDTAWATYAMSEPGCTVSSDYEIQQLIDSKAGTMHSDLTWPEAVKICPDPSKLRVTSRVREYGEPTLDDLQDGPRMSLLTAEKVACLARSIGMKNDDTLVYLHMSPRGVCILRCEGPILAATYLFMATRA